VSQIFPQLCYAVTREWWNHELTWTHYFISITYNSPSSKIMAKLWKYLWY